MTESRTHALLPGADLHLLKSTIADDEFEVSVTVLRIEVESRKRLPVVYVLDANLQFAMAAQTAWLMIFARELPEMIIVGIGHPVGSLLADPSVAQKYSEARRRHMEPIPVDPRQGQGAPDFLGFIRDELIPFVESTYPADAGDRTLFGHSLGGLFSLYVLFHYPEMFIRYIAGSPSLSGHGGVIHHHEREFATGRTSLPVKLFMSVASLEHHRVAVVEEMVETLKSRNYAGFDLTYDKFDGETHVSVVGHLLNRGLRAVFDDG